MTSALQFESEGHGTPLVFIHGWGLNSGVWQPLKEQLKTDFQVITVDLPGFGLNANHEMSPYTLNAISEKIQAVVTQPAVYIGWSLGGLVATRIAMTKPESTLALVTIASSPCFIETADWPGIKPAVLASFHQQLATSTEKTIAGFLRIQALGSPHVRHDIKQLHQLILQYPQPNRQTLDDSLALLESEDLRDELANITVPFLRLYGRLDSLVPKNVAEQVALLAPASRQFTFDQASHAPFISHPDEFYQLLLQWLLSNVSA